MRKIILTAILVASSYANINNINSFEADFLQNITDDKGTKITYNGHIKASKPRYALWQYIKPIQKSVYILPNKIVIIEPEIEQAIIKHLNGNFDFFKIIQNAKKVAKDTYLAKFENKEYTLKIESTKLKSISYKDEFENNVVINFKNQEENKKIPMEVYIPHIPEEYDIITE